VYWSVEERATDALVYVLKQSRGGSGISSGFYQLQETGSAKPPAVFPTLSKCTFRISKEITLEMVRIENQSILSGA
jgi:hypothetical protein